MARGIKDKVAILGMGCSKFGERWDSGAEELMLEAYKECLKDAGIDQNQLQAAWFSTAIDTQEPEPFSGKIGKINSYTADRLTYSPDPPAYYGMITFPEGGRFMAYFTDSDKEQVKVGTKMRMTFRMRDNDQMRGGFRRYFWKAAPV